MRNMRLVQNTDSLSTKTDASSTWFDEAVMKTYRTYLHVIVVSTLAGLVYAALRVLRPTWAKKLRWLVAPAVATLVAACNHKALEHHDLRENPRAHSTPGS